MPKINIREYDNTTSGITNYENFAVVVPGFVAADKIANYDLIAECAPGYESEGGLGNGIVEFTSQAKFVEVVGKVPAATPAIEAVAPTVSNTIASNVMPDYDYYNTYANVIYTGEIDPAGVTDVGYLVGKITIESTEHFIEYTKVDVANTPKYEQDPEDPESPEFINYYIIEAGNEGVNAVPGNSNNHYGNQMAYELLGLGYPVLYKKITAINELNSDAFWDCLRDKATYEFRYLVTGLLTDDSEGVIQRGASQKISALAAYINKSLEEYDPETAGRGDCIALVDVCSDAYDSATSQTAAVAGIKAEVEQLDSADKNTLILAPYVIYAMNDPDYNSNATFPASFHYLACAAYAFDVLGYNEWYAVSGFERGVSKYTVANVGYRFGDAAVQALQPRNDKSGLKRAVNLVIRIRNNYYIIGNRTAAQLPSYSAGEDLKASHFANIRQLCTTIKKRVYLACKKFQFDPNSAILWINFKNEIEPTLLAMQQDQGLKDFDFIKVISAKKALMSAIIRIVPIEAVEDFDISLTLEDSITGNGAVLISDNDQE